MRILYITLENLSLHKGSVVHIKEVIEGLQKRGHQVGLIGRAWTKLESGDHFYNIHPETLFLSKFINPKKKSYVISSILLFLTLIRILRKYDIIYARDFHTVIIALLPRLIFKKKLVYEINGIAHEEHKLRRYSILRRMAVYSIQKAEKIAVRWSNRIVSVTPQIKSYLISKYGCHPEKIHVIGNGVDTRKFYPIKDEALLLNWRRKIGIKKEEIVIVFVGNLAPWQGVEYLIKATPAISRQFQNIRFLIIGDGILKNRLFEQVKDLGISDYFVFTGMIDYQEIPFFINIGDICVLPKRILKSGYSPLKLYEYMACGKPIISSRIEGLEFIESEGVGILIEPEDIKSLEKALFSLIRDPQRRKDMGEKAFDLARRKFDWEFKLVEIEKILKTLA